MSTPSELYVQRRQRLLTELQGGIALIPSGSELIRNADTHFRFRPDSDFEYLTGLAEPQAVMLLTPHHAIHRFVLFVRPRDPERETWTGRRHGVEGALERFGADAAYPIDELAERLPEYMEGTRDLFYRLGYQSSLDELVIGTMNQLRSAKRRLTCSPVRIIDPSVPLGEMRVIKDPVEICLMKQAASITAQAHREAMAFTRPGRHEYEIEALIEYVFRRSGATGPAYPTIVGGGENGTILHYIENSQPLLDGELLLVDAGAEYQYYSADITRTYPINGRFSPQQRDVYQIVLDAQLAAIDQVRPGVPINQAHEVALRILTEGLVSLGLLKGSTASLLEHEAYKPYYMHRSSHYLGMDVHDAGEYVREGSSRLLEPGMIVTVEPGLYFGSEIPALAAAFKGIGVRIEDDILVTEAGPEVLTWEVPKSISDLEALVGSAQQNSPSRSLR